MNDHKIEIDSNSEEGFKKGMKELNNQLKNLELMKLEIDNLIHSMHAKGNIAIGNYCEGKGGGIILWIPEHLYKK